jgi:hypothetical protein
MSAVLSLSISVSVFPVCEQQKKVSLLKTDQIFEQKRRKKRLKTFKLKLMK